MNEPNREPRSISGYVRDRRLLGTASLLYLSLLPVGHLFVFSVKGARATITDIMLAVLLAAALVEGVRRGGRGATGEDLLRIRAEVSHPFVLSMACFLIFSLWVTLGAAWSANPGYALAKGAATAALALGALTIRWSGLDWRTAVDGWLVGSAIAIGVTGSLIFLGPESIGGYPLYHGGGVAGLPIPRFRGPFLHPNMLGDYLVVSGALLWVRWPEFSRSSRWLGESLGALIVGALVFSFSTAWLGAGLAIFLLGRGARRGSIVWRGAGAAIVLVALVGILFPLRMEVLGSEVVCSGTRPSIWASSVRTYLDSPLVGVGASPVVAEAPTPLLPDGPVVPWDAHSLYLSVLTQFGLPGVLLFGAGVALLVKTLWQAEASRRRSALLAALLAVAIHGGVTASEDFRHLWALMGLLGLMMRSESEGMVTE